jgi:fucose 4-O-acetylase-like acetyltransferase
MSQGERFHSLDNLRAVIMWLGVVLHVGVNHMQGESRLPWRDSVTTPWADLIVVWIHVYRMPLFFILAGFFAAMLVSRNDFKFMLEHRFKRIVLPFIAFWPPLFVLTALLVMMYVHLMETGTIGLDPNLVRDPADDQPKLSPMHLWFIYDLIWLCLLSIPIYWFIEKLKPSIKAKCLVIHKILATKWWGFLLLSLPLAGIGAFYHNGLAHPSGSFIPSIGELGHNGLFFLFGWLLFSHRENIFQHYQKYAWRYGLAGAVTFFVSLMTLRLAREGTLPTLQANITGAYVFNSTTWLWSFAIIGLFLRYLPDHNKFMLYISNSSYWVYLVHMLGTIGFGILLYNMDFSAITKMLINITLTTVFGLATYHWFVRFSFIGKFLNGHKYLRTFTQQHTQQ